MFPFYKRIAQKILRSTGYTRLITGLFFALILTTNQSVADGARPRFAEALPPEAVHPFLESFRRQGLQGDYSFKFLLEHLPRRGRTIRYEGTLWGSWNENGPVSRFAIDPGVTDQENGRPATREWIVQNGGQQQAWAREGMDGTFEPINATALMEPLFEGVLYRPFDLLMPFIYWDDYEYEGPKAIGTRLAHQFLMKPPAGFDLPQVHAVRLSLDSEYRALMRIEILDTSGEALTRFEVESFKKVQGQYIVKRITLGEQMSGERTRFRVMAAVLNLELPMQVFDAEKNIKAPEFAPEKFTEL